MPGKWNIERELKGILIVSVVFFILNKITPQLSTKQEGFFPNILMNFENFLLLHVPVWLPFLVLVLLFISLRIACRKTSRRLFYTIGSTILFIVFFIHTFGFLTAFSLATFRGGMITGFGNIRYKNIVKPGKIGKPGEISGKIVDGDMNALVNESIALDLWVFPVNSTWSPADESSINNLQEREMYEKSEESGSTDIVWTRIYFKKDKAGNPLYSHPEYFLKTFTNEEGEFIFDCFKNCPAPSRFTLNYGEKRLEIENGTRGLVLQIIRNTCDVKLTFVTSDDIFPLTQVKVWVMGTDDYGGTFSLAEFSRPLMTDASGSIVISQLKAGGYELICSAGSFLHEIVELRVGREKAVERTVAMNPGARVCGRSVNRSGKPVSGITIRPLPHSFYKPEKVWMIQNWKTNKNGEFDTGWREPGTSDTIPPGK